MNEFFNFKPKSKSTLGCERNIRKNERRVLDALFNHRVDGGNFVAADGLDSVATSLGIGRRVVEGVYRENKDSLKGLPKNRDEGIMHINGDLGTLLELAQFNRTQHNK